MKQTQSVLKTFMTASQRSALGDLPTSHDNCMRLFKVARPGKTKRDLAKRGAL